VHYILSAKINAAIRIRQILKVKSRVRRMRNLGSFVTSLYTTDRCCMLHCRHTITRWYTFFFLWDNCHREPTVTGKFWLISFYLFRPTWLPILLADSHIWVIRALDSHIMTWVHFTQIRYWLYQEELP